MFKIIRAGNTDVVLAQQAISEVHGRRVTDAVAISAFLRDPTCYLLMALEDERVIGSLLGYALWHPHRLEPQFLLYEIDVRLEHRNGGVGTALVTNFIAEARAAGACKLWTLTTESNTSAMNMYAHCGLTRQHRDDAMVSLTLKDGSA